MKEIGTAVQESFTGDQAIIFGPYRLLPRQRVLLEMNKPVRLGNRALDILIILVERAGEIVSKEELIAHTWPNTHVEETNLRVHMAALRKVLGEGQAGTRYIENIIGRGYSFVAAASREEGTPRPILFRASTDQGHNLPAPLSRMIGRSETVRTLAAQVSQHRFVTIVGPPGIGKTTVALSIAEKLLDAYEHDVQFIDFGSISDSALVPSLLASVLGIPILSDGYSVLRHLGCRQHQASFLQRRRLDFLRSNFSWNEPWQVWTHFNSPMRTFPSSSTFVEGLTVFHSQSNWPPRASICLGFVNWPIGSMIAFIC